MRCTFLSNIVNLIGNDNCELGEPTLFEDPRPRSGDGYSAIEIGTFGRHDAVLARSDGPPPHRFAVYVRPQQDPGLAQRAFKEGHVLMLLGFRPRARCKFFAVGCALAGGFELLLDQAPGKVPEADARALFARLAADLAPILDQVAWQMASASDLGLSIELPRPRPD